MASPEAALGFLRENLGIGENPDGSNHNWLTDWFGVGDVAWCAITVSRALIAAGFGTPDLIDVPGVRQDYRKGTAFVPNLRNYYIDAGLYDKNPKVGDVVIFVWGPGSPIGDHTGLVEQVVGDGTVVTLEGNHANDLVRMRRSMAVIDGFGHPPYSPVVVTPERELGMLTFRYTNSGLDWVFDGPSKLFFQLNDLRQITEVLDPLGVKALGPVSDITHKRYSEIAAAANFSG